MKLKTYLKKLDPNSYVIIKREIIEVRKLIHAINEKIFKNYEIDLVVKNKEELEIIVK